MIGDPLLMSIASQDVGRPYSNRFVQACHCRCFWWHYRNEIRLRQNIRTVGGWPYKLQNFIFSVLSGIIKLKFVFIQKINVDAK
jgi:hypothetical protein